MSVGRKAPARLHVQVQPVGHDEERHRKLVELVRQVLDLDAATGWQPQGQGEAEGGSESCLARSAGRRSPARPISG